MRDDRPGADAIERAIFSLKAAAPYCAGNGSPIIAGWLNAAAAELETLRGAPAMNNTPHIQHAVELARSANRLAIYHTCTGHPARAVYWVWRRTEHMTAARQLRNDQ